MTCSTRDRSSASRQWVREMSESIRRSFYRNYLAITSKVLQLGHPKRARRIHIQVPPALAALRGGGRDRAGSPRAALRRGRAPRGPPPPRDARPAAAARRPPPPAPHPPPP